MKVQQHVLQNGTWTGAAAPESTKAQLALVFSSAALLAQPDTWAQLSQRLPHARIVGCSTAGEIAGTAVQDDTLVCTSIEFEHSQIAIAAAALDEAASSEALGALLVSRLPAQNLVHVLVLSEGLKVNGSALISGITQRLPPHVAVTGGLAADGSRFQKTSVCVDGPEPSTQTVAIGLYGSNLRVGYGCVGGWDSFGIERCITKSEGNVLWELDGEPVLDLYKRYLGEHARGLPATGLLFPLAIRPADSDGIPVVRTILAVDEQNKTLTFAGDMPLRYRARLMKANVERLVDGAQAAGAAAQQLIGATRPSLALLISCIGRKLVLKQRVEEEVEAVGDALGAGTVLSGFYSYGELSPAAAFAPCGLHNQTMTVTTIAER